LSIKSYTNNEILSIAKDVLDNEASAILKVKDILNESFCKAVDILFNCKGKIVVTGMGKSGNIGKKISATLTSTGTTAVFLNPAEAIHGDIGILAENDVLLALSKSGNTEEINTIIPFVKRLGIPVISIVNEKDSSLDKSSDVSLYINVDKEACPMNLAPTTSTTAMLALGDAIAVTLMHKKGISENEFKLFHPGGMIGKQLLLVRDIMETENLPFISPDETVKQALEIILSKNNRGIVIVVDNNKNLSGILVDGDLKRIALKYEGNFLNKKVSEVMTKNPKTIKQDCFVSEALKIMENKYTSLIVTQDNIPTGLLHIHDILLAKII